MLTPEERALLAIWQGMTPEDREAARLAQRERETVRSIGDALAQSGLSAETHPELVAVLEVVARFSGAIVEHNARGTEFIRVGLITEFQRLEQKVDGLGVRIDGHALDVGQTEAMIEQARAMGATYTQEVSKSIRAELADVRETAEATRLSSRYNGYLLYGFIVFVLVLALAFLLAQTAGAATTTSVALVLVVLARRLAFGGVA